MRTARSLRSNLVWVIVPLLGCSLVGAGRQANDAAKPAPALAAQPVSPPPENPPLELVDHHEELPYVYFECEDFDVAGCNGVRKAQVVDDEAREADEREAEREAEREPTRVRAADSTRILAQAKQQLAAACPKLAFAKIDLQGEDIGLGYVTSRTRGDLLIVHWFQNYGQGVYDHYDEIRDYVYDTKQCTVRTITAGHTGGLFESVEANPVFARFAPNSVEAELTGEWADCSDPRHGFACMYLRWPYAESADSLELPKGRDWELVTLTRKPGAWVAGKLVEQVATYWTLEEHARHLVEKPQPDPEDPDGYVVPPAAKPVQVGQTGEYRLFQSRLPDREVRLAFAVERHDGKVREHRWIGHTRECLLADDVEWLLAGDDLIVGFAAHMPLGPTRSGIDGLFVIDLREGMIHRLLVRELVELLELDPDESPLQQEASFDDEEIRERVRIAGKVLQVGKLELTTATLRKRITQL
jgi:hypothetical protein